MATTNRLPLLEGQPLQTPIVGVPGTPKTLRLALADADGAAINLTGRTAVLQVLRGGGGLHLTRQMTVDSAAAGEVSLTLSSLDTTLAGEFIGRVLVLNGGVTERALPSGRHGVTISLAGADGADRTLLQQAVDAAPEARLARDAAQLAEIEAEAHRDAAAASEARTLAAEGLVAAGAIHDSVEAYDDLDSITPVAGRLRLVRETGQAYERVGSEWVYRGDVFHRTASAVTALLAYSGGPGAARDVEGLRGGRFRWSSTGTADDVLTFEAANGYWAREWDGGTVRAEWAGASPANAAVVNTIAIQAALDTGYDVAFSRGIYDVRQAGIGSQSMTGEGTTWRLDSTLTPGPGLDGTNSNLLMLYPKTDGARFTVSGITFDQRSDVYGDRSDSPCLSVQNVAAATITGCTTTRVLTMAIWCDSQGSDETRGLLVTGNRGTDSIGGWFSVFGNVTGANVSGNIIDQCGDDAIAFQTTADGSYPRRGTIAANLISDCTTRSDIGGGLSTPRGILVFGGSLFTVEGNIVDGTVSAGIAVTVAQHPITGVVFRRADHITLTGNIVSRAGLETGGDGTAGVPGHAYTVFGADHVSLEGCRSSGSREAGVNISDATQVKVNGGEYADVGSVGLRIEDSDYVTADGGTFGDAGHSGAEPYSAAVISTTKNCTGIKIRNCDLHGTGDVETCVLVANASGQAPVDLEVTGNDLTGGTAAGLAGSIAGFLGTGYLVEMNKSTAGAKGRARGLDAIPAAVDGLVVTHGMGAAPLFIQLTGAGQTLYRVGTVTDTTFTVQRDAPFTLALGFVWDAVLDEIS